MNTFNVRNYTSTVPPARTAERIKSFLAGAGATRISKCYADGNLVGIDFAIAVEEGIEVAFRLPVDTEAMLNYMVKQRKGWLSNDARARIRKQASITAWRIMQDWVESQLSLVVTKQAEMAQVFMPYAFSGEKTYYSVVKERGFAMLAAPKGDTEA